MRGFTHLHFSNKEHPSLPAFGQGVISVAAAFDFDAPDDPVRKTVKALADRLGAVVVGDEGETYDF